MSPSRRRPTWFQSRRNCRHVSQWIRASPEALTSGVPADSFYKGCLPGPFFQSTNDGKGIEIFVSGSRKYYGLYFMGVEFGCLI